MGARHCWAERLDWVVSIASFEAAGVAIADIHAGKQSVRFANLIRWALGRLGQPRGNFRETLAPRTVDRPPPELFLGFGVRTGARLGHHRNDMVAGN
jgi:hypothetical protein